MNVEAEIVLVTRKGEEIVFQDVVTGMVTFAEQGPARSAAFISTDPDNMTREGTDGGLYTPDLVADPLAYYILAKA